MKTLSLTLILAAVLLCPTVFAGTNAPCCAKPLAPTQPPALTDKSIYQVDSTFTDDHGKPVKLSSLAGQPVVLTMFFAQCNFACPILANDMKKIEAALPAEVRRKTRFVLVSFDSDRDTPEALARYRKSRQIPNDWLLLTGKRDDILELAALLGVKYKKESTGQFAHSNLSTLLNTHGEIIRQQIGLNTDPSEFVAALRRAATAEKLTSQ
jgi:protein SCO1/2